VATELVLPMLGIQIENGKIVEWLKAEGEAVEKGESVFLVETEKVETEVESPVAGTLAKILCPAGTEVPVLTVVGVITAPGEQLAKKYTQAQPVSAVTMETTAPAALEQPVSAATGEKAASSTPPAAVGGPLRAMPAARQLAKNEGLDLSALIGTGPKGEILLKDVREALAAGGTAAVMTSTLAARLARKEGLPLAGVQGSGVRGRIMRADVEEAVSEAATPRLGKVLPFDSMRQVIARRMAESAFTAPHIYFFADVCLDALLAFRQSVVADFEQRYALKPSVNDFLIKAVAQNILDFPILNATFQGQEIHIPAEVNIGMAVALPGGLVVPAVAGADRAGLAEISRQRTDLVQRARSGKLSMEEMQRGTFTISSLAQYDINSFTAIINPPQSGILSVGKTRDELALVDGQVVVKKVATFGLSVDHRVIDGAVAAEFLQNLKWKLERPAFTFLAQ
jgi:pyruvate dehydrogenase E2 component (dihydrolipoamide acetyltransferase)